MVRHVRGCRQAAKHGKSSARLTGVMLRSGLECQQWKAKCAVEREMMHCGFTVVLKGFVCVRCAEAIDVV